MFNSFIKLFIVIKRIFQFKPFLQIKYKDLISKIKTILFKVETCECIKKHKKSKHLKCKNLIFLIRSNNIKCKRFKK